MLFTTFGAAPDHVIVVHGFATTAPEPSSIVLSVTGLLLLTAVARRRR
jgi:hypothetical protein